MSRRLALAALLLCACSSPAPQGAPAVVAPPPPPAAKPGAPPPPPAPAPELGSPSFELNLAEVPSSGTADSPVIVRVFVDGKLAGATAPAPRFQPKRWSAALPDGDRRVRVELLDARPDGSGGFTFEPWPAERQPPEKAVRVFPGELTSVTLRLLDGGRRVELAAERRPR